MTKPAAPLYGVRVLDLSTFLAGPYCTQLLADLGADVIKVEPPQGDPTRHLPPHSFEGQGAYYLSINHTKRSVCLDLTLAAGREVLKRLVGASDIVVQNYRPGLAPRLGADFDTLAEVNPSLIYCAISGFGQDGPYSDRPAYDMVVQALSGGMSLTGEKGQRPVRSGIPIGDLCAGEQAALAISAALAGAVRHGSDGHGQAVFIDISMLDVQVSLLTYLAQYYLLSGVIPGPQGRGHESIPTYAAFQARDGREVVICANTEPMWQRMCRALDLDVLLDDPRFATNASRLEYRDQLDSIILARFRKESSGSLLDRLTSHSVPCAPVNDIRDALQDPQVIHRKMIASVMHASGKDLPLIAGAIRFVGQERPTPGAPPSLGEHTYSVLEEIGLSPSQLAQLHKDGVIDRECPTPSNGRHEQSTAAS